MEGEYEKKWKECFFSDDKTPLAAIIYEDNTCSEWMGVEIGKKEDYINKDLIAIFCIGKQEIKKDYDEN